MIIIVALLMGYTLRIDVLSISPLGSFRLHDKRHWFTGQLAVM